MKRVFFHTRLTSFVFLLFLLGVGIAGVQCTGAGGGAVGPIDTPLSPQAASNPGGIRAVGGEENPQGAKKVAFFLTVSAPDGKTTNCGRANTEAEVIFPDDNNHSKLQILFGASQSQTFSNPKEPFPSMGPHGRVRFGPDCPLAFSKSRGIGNTSEFIVVNTAKVVVTFTDGANRFQTIPIDLACDTKPQDPPREVCLTLKPESELAETELLANLIKSEDPPATRIITPPSALNPPSTVDDDNAQENLNPNQNLRQIDVNDNFQNLIDSISVRPRP